MTSPNTPANHTPNPHQVPATDSSENVLSPALVLLGLPGSGVADIAAHLADQHGMLLRDAEEQMAQEAGKPIADVLIQDGEDVYRDLELAASLWACLHQGIALVGAGMLEREDFWEDLSPSLVIGLDVDVKTALKNLGLGAAASAVINPRATWMRQAETRRQQMQRRCHHTVEVTDLSVENVAAQITAHLANK